jgi:hypothetical protein
MSSIISDLEIKKMKTFVELIEQASQNSIIKKKNRKYIYLKTWFCSLEMIPVTKKQKQNLFTKKDTNRVKKKICKNRKGDLWKRLSLMKEDSEGKKKQSGWRNWFCILNVY